MANVSDIVKLFNHENYIKDILSPAGAEGVFFKTKI